MDEKKFAIVCDQRDLKGVVMSYHDTYEEALSVLLQTSMIGDEHYGIFDFFLNRRVFDMDKATEQMRSYDPPQGLILDDTVEQLRGVKGFVASCRRKTISDNERHGFLTYAIMHICQAAIYGDSDPRFCMYLHDYKHVLMKAAKSIMDGIPIDEAMANVPDLVLLDKINWNYRTPRDIFNK